MKTSIKLTTLGAILCCSIASAQVSSNADGAPSGMSRMKAVMDSVANKKGANPDLTTQQAIATGLQSAQVSSNVDRMDARTVDFSLEQSAKIQQLAREAYVAALPPKDRALGASVMLGDRTGGKGQIYIFVSRSMPQSLLRAYAVDAFYLGAKLVFKGVRKGDTIKEYMADAIENFNSVDGMTMAGLDINPNLFDMFGVNVVPAVVWSDIVGLDDIGSGCQNPPDDAPVEKMSLTGPNDTELVVDRPVCAKAPDTAFYKLSGALALPYVLDRFQDAGLARPVVDGYRALLAERTTNMHDGTVTQGLGNAMAPITPDAKLDRLPKYVLQSIQEQLVTGNVQRGPFGPTFSPDFDDDVAYRQELTEKIRHGLGL